jgi:hypothetical protein
MIGHSILPCKRKKLCRFFEEAWYNHTGEENRELVMLTKKKVLRIIQKNEEEIKACGVEEIGIFGSFVKSAQ